MVAFCMIMEVYSRLSILISRIINQNKFRSIVEWNKQGQVHLKFKVNNDQILTLKVMCFLVQVVLVLLPRQLQYYFRQVYWIISLFEVSLSILLPLDCPVQYVQYLATTYCLKVKIYRLQLFTSFLCKVINYLIRIRFIQLISLGSVYCD